jgi:hypothetical protein
LVTVDDVHHGLKEAEVVSTLMIVSLVEKSTLRSSSAERIADASNGLLSALATPRAHASVVDRRVFAIRTNGRDGQAITVATNIALPASRATSN